MISSKLRICIYDTYKWRILSIPFKKLKTCIMIPVRRNSGCPLVYSHISYFIQSRQWSLASFRIEDGSNVLLVLLINCCMLFLVLLGWSSGSAAEVTTWRNRHMLQILTIMCEIISDSRDNTEAMLDGERSDLLTQIILWIYNPIILFVGMEQDTSETSTNSQAGFVLVL